MFTPTDHNLTILATASPFAMDILKKQGDKAYVFLERFGLDRVVADDEFVSLVQEFVGAQPSSQISQSQVAQGLRQLRQLLMLKWIWQDALGVICLEQLTHELSVFADACVCFCQEYVYQGLIERYGEPMVKVDGKTVRDEFAVIAMGKMGAMELNLSSDIDLIFIHTGIGETVGKKCVDTQKFMTALGRGIIKLLGEVSEHGFVFRVDMRLRPWGDGSSLVMTLPALQKYFGQHGRTWERFAWLKARVVNDISEAFLEKIHQIRRVFVHRYYVDYTAFSALREMKMLIVSQQTQRQDLDNVKLGVGGIRDIEFIVQAFALIYGGHHTVIADNPACLDALAVLTKLGYLDSQESDDLEQAYRFLRRLEHAIQARHDEQTQKLPSNDTELVALATTLGFKTVAQFKAQLTYHRQKVSAPFERMVTDRQSLSQETTTTDDVHEQLTALLSSQSMALLDDFLNSRLVSALDDEPKHRLNTAYPVLMHALLSHAKSNGGEQADIAVPRLIELLEAICRRSIYLVMMAENPNATVGLIPMLSVSPWIAKELALHPMLLDNFLQKRYLHLPDKAELTDILRQSLLRVEPFDDESYLGAIRVFKKTQVLAVATADILGLRHIMKVSDSLTFIAEVVLSSAIHRAFGELAQKHGTPKLLTGEMASEENMGFAIIGYGKLGGLEMSYASDLDVVFLHNIDEKADTDGAKAVSGMKFASRLVQKVLGYLTTQTRDGRAYEMDMRLRPSGNAGVMVISVGAFETYQHQKAWAWEHQALVRARGIAGDKTVLAEFDRIRQALLTLPRHTEQVKADVLSMRQKMQTHLGTHDSRHQFNLKQDFGGLVDIEFLAQFMVLAYAHKYPTLATWSDNVRIFEEVAKTGIWDSSRCEMLTQAYLDLRKKTHELALSDQTITVNDEAWEQIRTFVRGVWEMVLATK